MQYDAVLDGAQILAGRPFTDPVNTEREADVMRTMLAHERERARRWREEAERPGIPRGMVVREHDDEDHRHLIVVPDLHALLGASDVTAVGFFARPRQDVDHGILFDLEDELVGRMDAYANLGLLSYYDVELVKGAYGNLILFSTSDVPPEWHRDPVHRRATEVSPRHYHEVRLHKGTVPGPLVGDGTLVLERTKYFDFDADPTWLGLRQFAAPV